MYHLARMVDFPEPGPPTIRSGVGVSFSMYALNVSKHYSKDNGTKLKLIMYALVISQWAIIVITQVQGEVKNKGYYLRYHMVGNFNKFKFLWISCALLIHEQLPYITK